MLFPDEQMLVSVVDRPSALALDEKPTVFCGDEKVRCVGTLSLWHRVWDFVRLVFNFETRSAYLCRQFVL